MCVHKTRHRRMIDVTALSSCSTCIVIPSSPQGPHIYLASSPYSLLRFSHGSILRILTAHASDAAFTNAKCDGTHKCV